MPVVLLTEVKARYRSALLVQLTQSDVSLNTIDDAILQKAIDDATGLLEETVGEDFEYTGISSRDLLWQTRQVCMLTLWQLEANLARESVYSDTRYQKWAAEVRTSRDRNKVINPVGSTNVTSVSSKPDSSPTYPQMQDPNFDSFVPGNDNNGSLPSNPTRGGRGA